MPINEHALEFLGRLERAETTVLTWGLIDGFFSDSELEQQADSFLAELLVNGVISGYSSGWEMIDALLEGHLLWRIPETDRYRTRMGEAIRLFAKLRQIFPDAGQGAWRGAPNLVADYRLLIRPRMFPRREVAPDNVLSALSRQTSLTPLHYSVVRAMIRAGTPEERPLAGFQVRATARILREFGQNRAMGTIICAGTGTGKTLAFYLPTYAAIATRISNEYWTKCLALYPRNELLKDQLRDALSNARRVAPALAAVRKRKLVLGALYSDVPHTARNVSWPRVRAGIGQGYECPFIRCPGCGQRMLWLETDVQRQHERLVCATERCGESVEADEIRLTRERMFAEPPDILFTSTEMLNQRMSSARFARLLGIGLRAERRPDFVLLDEVHTYEGVHGAQVALLMRRWRRAAEARPHFVGLSATLADAPRFLAELVGIGIGDVSEITPEESELRAQGREYLLALRGDPSSGTSLLSTTIQALMLLRRIVGTRNSDSYSGCRIFAFTDNLDVINRLYHNLLDAEGLDAFSRPNARRPGGSLANLRGSTLPNARERMQAGQNWAIVEDIGHILAPASRIRIGRTSSQDTGVDPNADIIVATSSLEVGFDDPDVGGVLHHKAPQSPAAFLQRKGRAGRRQEMRPWTVVVLSDYGRDRNAYQAYDQLFSPHLPPRHLPLTNRAVIRMQATYALLDWLARRLPSSYSPEPWTDLSQPSDAIHNTTFAQEVRERQTRYADYLRDLLQKTSVREEFATFLARSLSIDEQEVQAVLWQPPRSLLTEAVPTLLRRLEQGWRRASDLAPESYISRAPLPEFIPRTLFSDLHLPEILIRIPAVGRLDARTEFMPLVQGLREFAPGRVSRRFGVAHGGERYWIEPDNSGEVLIDTFCPAIDRHELGSFSYVDENGNDQQIPVFRPYALDVQHSPSHVQQSSNSFLEWRAEVLPTGDGHEVDAPDPSPWAAILRPFRFHTHNLGMPIEMRRFAVGAVASVGRGRGGQITQTLHFSVPAAASTIPAALGFAADVDAIRVRFVYPLQLHELRNGDERLAQGLRTARFRDLIRTTILLDGIANLFQRDWLAQIYLSTVIAEALRTGSNLQEAESTVHGGSSSTRISEILGIILQWSENDPDDDEVGPGDNLPRRVQELTNILNLGETKAALHQIALTLWEPIDVTWEPWLRTRFKSTLGAALLESIFNLCPRIEPGALLVDLTARCGQPEQFARTGVADTDELWISEGTMGGGGFIEEFLAKYVEDPRRYFRLVDAALGPSDLESVGNQLNQLLQLVVSGNETSRPLVDGFAAIRQAESHGTGARALDTLRRSLARTGILPTRTLMVSLNTRILGPGTNSHTDALLADLIRDWDASERRLGVDIDARVFALVRSSDPSLEAALGVLPIGESEASRASWRYGVLSSMLWPRAAQTRADSLRLYNPFARVPECDRLLLLASIARTTTQVSVALEDWFDQLSHALVRDGSAELIASVHELEVLTAALLRLASEPVDSETLLIHARLIGVYSDGELLRAELELPEAFQ